MKDPTSEGPPRRPTSRHVSRRSAFRHLFAPAQLKQTLVLAEQPSLQNSLLAGLQAAAVILIAIPLVRISPWPHLVGFAALGALPALFGRFHLPAERGHVVAKCGVWQTLAVLGMGAVVRVGAGPYAQLVVLALACGLFYFVVSTMRPGPPGALIFIFGAGAAMAPTPTWGTVFAQAGATAMASVVSWLVCLATERWRQRASASKTFPMEPLHPISHRLSASARVTVGAGLAVFLVHALGAKRPEWAAMGAVAVMQGVHLHVNLSRALQRMIGTFIGAGIVWLILSQEPGAWVVIASIALFQVLTEVVIGYNYALGQIVITPMALLMSYLAAPPGTADASMAGERVLDTVIGASLGLLLALIASNVDDRVYLVNRRRDG